MGKWDIITVFQDGTQKKWNTDSNINFEKFFKVLCLILTNGDGGIDIGRNKNDDWVVKNDNVDFPVIVFNKSNPIINNFFNKMYNKLKIN